MLSNSQSIAWAKNPRADHRTASRTRIEIGRSGGLRGYRREIRRAAWGLPRAMVVTGERGRTGAGGGHAPRRRQFLGAEPVAIWTDWSPDWCLGFAWPLSSRRVLRDARRRSAQRRRWRRRGLTLRAGWPRWVLRVAIFVLVVLASVRMRDAPVYSCALQAVPGLKPGRTSAPEPTPVPPVSWQDVEAVLSHVAPQVQAMVLLQWYSGMRPGEVVLMRTRDIERGGDVWTFTPESHKTEHHGRERRIELGPRAQAVLAPWLRLDPARFLFQPAGAEGVRVRAQRQARQSKVQPS